ncbi:SipW-dependent-type signal peptide-containing protein [Candidatus Saccharibacteria bacterium]|nr:SipW-dependent-type signal peptide-containing protein [Candidatus Saccharibacteria bacterium]
MYRKIRITAIAMVLAVICIASSSGTLSYFTDTDDAENNFVVGRVASSVSVYKDTNKTAFSEADYGGNNPLVPKKEIDYFVEAENTGNIEAYQRFRIVIPITLKDVISLKLYGNLSSCDVKVNDVCENEDYKVTYDDSVEVESVPTYAEYYIESKNILAKDGKTANWPTSALYIEENAENIDLSELACGESSNNCTLGVKVYSDTIQTYGFDNVSSAFVNFTETY